MADEDITLDGKPLQSLRVADLKAALEQRNLPKSGQKNTLIKRLKGALMLENLQKSSSSHSGLQPNSQIGEEMCQNSFIKQYLAKQQELLRQRLEREAQQEEDADESPAVPDEDEDHSEDNDNSSYIADKQQHRAMRPQPSLSRPEDGAGEPGLDLTSGSALLLQESSNASGTRMQRATFLQGLKEATAPSPPRAVASLSVRVLGQPDRQGLPPTVPRPQEKEGTAPSEPGSAHPVLHLSRSAGGAAGSRAQEDSDEADDDESDDDEDWGPGSGGVRRGNRVPLPPQQMPPSAPSAAARSKRKLQPPQHIPPPQVHHTPMQLRHPTPPPSPPPNLFPLPDTPKQSPPDDHEGERPNRAASFPAMQRQDSDSSSGSSSPEPPTKRRPGPLSLLVHKMESEKAFRVGETTAAAGTAGEDAHSSSNFPQGLKTKTQESRDTEEEKERERQLEREKKRLEEEKEKERKQREEEQKQRQREEQEKERKRQEEEKEKERKRLEEEQKQRQREEQEKERKQQEEAKEQERKRQEEIKEKERKRQEEEKERKRQAEEKERKRQAEEKEKERKRLEEEEKRKAEKKLKEEQEKKQERSKMEKVVVTLSQDSDSSSDSDSKSDSSSRSSHSSSSSSSGGKGKPAHQLKKADQREEAEDEKKTSKGAEKRYPPKREVSEPSAAAVTEVEPESESSMAQQPASGAEPENSEGRLEESTTPKAFAARKISLTSSKTSPAPTDGGAADSDTSTAAGRKRRWGSSTAVTAKKPSISITTDSLKSLIPDIKVNQDAVVELHPEELQSSGEEEENLDTSRDDPDKGLKIRRTVTQVVPGDSQENGQTNEGEEEEEEQEEEEEEEMEAEKPEKEKHRRTSRDKRKNSVCEEAPETQTSVKVDGEAKKITPSDSLVRRSISQQKSGVSVTIDDPVRAARQPSPPRGKLSNIIHVTNLVRPFTLIQLKELLNRTGTVVEEGFWIDKIKSHCFVTYATIEEAVATRTSLHGVKWPTSNPKVLNVDFSEQVELDFHKGILKPAMEEELPPPPGPPPTRLPPLMPERERERERDRGVRDLWAEREREMERRERARGEREWDRDKVREFARPGDDGRRSRSRDRERRRRERAKSKERKTDKKAEKGDEPPAKLLDDLFLKTKAAPCIYWLPLTEEQAAQRLLDRTERQKERERRRKEQEEEDKKREEEKLKERLKGRDKDGGVSVGGGGGGGGGGAAGRGGGGGGGGDADRERGRGREREADKKRDSSHRSRRASAGPGAGGRRSRSRSNPRDRRR